MAGSILVQEGERCTIFDRQGARSVFPTTSGEALFGGCPFAAVDGLLARGFFVAEASPAD